MDATQLAALDLTDLLARVDSFCEHMDPGNLVNKFAAKGFAAELKRRHAAGHGTARPKQRYDLEIVDALDALVNWACG